MEVDELEQRCYALTESIATKVDGWFFMILNNNSVQAWKEDRSYGINFSSNRPKPKDVPDSVWEKITSLV